MGKLIHFSSLTRNLDSVISESYTHRQIYATANLFSLTIQISRHVMYRMIISDIYTSEYVFQKNMSYEI